MPSAMNATEIELKENHVVTPENPVVKQIRLSTILASLRQMPRSSRVSETMHQDQFGAGADMLTRDPFIFMGSCSG